MPSSWRKIWRRVKAGSLAVFSASALTRVFLASSATALLLAPPLLPSARAIELGTSFGYGALGYDGLAPYMKASMSFGKRFVIDFNGGLVFANKNIGFSNFGKIVAVQDEIRDVKKPSGNVLYTVGMDIRVFVRKGDSRHNAYLGGGVDWLPQLGTYYPGVKILTGYQLSLLKKRSLNLRFGAEYYLYGVVPVNALTITTAISYRI